MLDFEEFDIQEIFYKSLQDNLNLGFSKKDILATNRRYEDHEIFQNDHT